MKKRFLAIWLAVVLAVMAVMPAMAETKESSQGWQKIDEDTWVYLDSNSERVTNTLRRSGRQFWWLDEDGILVTHGNEGKEIVYEDIHFYLNDNGSIQPEGWDDSGRKYNIYELFRWQTNTGWYAAADKETKEEFAWIYYDNDGVSVKGRQDINDWKYYFVESTDTFQEEAVGVIKWADRGKIIDDYYIQRDYSIAVSRWIPVGGQWRYFDENGKYDREKKDLPFEELDIQSIVLKDIPKEAVVGTKIEIPFEIMVKAADDGGQSTPSNAVKASSNNAESGYSVKEVEDYSIFTQAYDVSHTYRANVGVTDPWYEEGKSRLRPDIETKFDIDWERQVIQIPAAYYGAVFGRLEINGVKSNDFGIVCQYAAAEGSGNGGAKENVEGILNAFDSDDSGMSVEDTIESLKNVEDLKGGFEALLDDNLEEKLWKLEFSNNAQKGINANSEVDRTASVLLRGRDVKVAGLGLNAKENSTITLKVKASQEAVPADFNTGYRTVPMDLSVVSGGKTINNLAIPAVITFPIPAGISGDKLELYHIHKGVQEPVVFRYDSDEQTVTFVADTYSVFLFAQKTDTTGSTGSSGGSGGGGGSRSTAAASGTWIQDAVGWWFKNPDGSYPYGCWKELAYNGTSAWYHFSAEGYMQTGWFTDADGRVYYLNPVSDGTQGAMATGWKLIDGYWYYFNEISDGYKGALSVNTVTPDGYQVDGQGRWVQ